MKQLFSRIAVMGMALVALASTANAQSVAYKIKRDDPYHVNNFMLRLDPSYMDLYFTNLNFGYAVGADYIMNRVLDFTFNWRRTYWDMNEWDMRNYGPEMDLEGNPVGDALVPKNGFKTTSYTEAIGRLHFSDKLIDASHRLILSQSSSTSGNTTTTTSKYIDVPGKQRKIVSLEGGLLWQNVPILFEGGALSDASPAIFMLTNKDDEADTLRGFGGGGTMMQTASIVAGLSFQKISNLKALTDIYGVKYSTLWTNFYFDVMYSPVVGFTALRDTSGALYDVDLEGGRVKNLGWRMGYIMKNTKGTWWTISYNFGVKPGFVYEDKLITNRVYIDMNLGFSLSEAIRFSKKG